MSDSNWLAKRPAEIKVGKWLHIARSLGGFSQIEDSAGDDFVDDEADDDVEEDEEEDGAEDETEVPVSLGSGQEGR